MQPPFPPATSEPSIYEHVQAQLDEAGRLVGSALPLPDDEKVVSGGRTRWVAGGLDGVTVHHRGSGAAEDQAAEVARLFFDAAEDATDGRLREVYAAVADDNVLEFLDPMLEALAALGPRRLPLLAVGRWLATTASDRGAVKVGMAILGVASDGGDEATAVLRTLGAHDEFTLFAVVALRRSLDEPDSEVWALATAVDGWGRIHCVERLSGTDDPAIQAWILRHGFRNSIMDEYLAYTAATTGRMVEALRAGDVDRELLTAAGEILEALIFGGPAEDIDDYPDAVNAVEAYLALMRTRAETIGDLRAVRVLRNFLRDDEHGDWDARSRRGWTVERREALSACCDEIIGRDEWTDRITVGLVSEDPREFWSAERAARERGIDTFDGLVGKIRIDPLLGPWYRAWRQANTARARQLVDLVRASLPLNEIASGPGDELGRGDEWLPHQALGRSLRGLPDHPGIGPDLVLVGLRSPVVGNRTMSLKVLEAWSRPDWPSEAVALVEVVAASDPDEQVRELAAEVLAPDRALD